MVELSEYVSPIFDGSIQWMISVVLGILLNESEFCDVRCIFNRPEQ